MIRLVLFLCGGLYLALMVLGQDHGQKRYGLMMADQLPKVAAPTPAVLPVQEAVFIPAPAVMQPVPPVAKPQDTVALPPPQVDGGILYSVAAATANVRAGPGKNFAVLGSLGKGEQVLVVAEDQPIDGWSRVRIEGDGVEGFVATRLLTPAQ